MTGDRENIKKKRAAITVSGRVQGVFFRVAAKRAADAWGIAGFAKNQRDGSVLIEAEGEASAIDRFCEWCRRGPAGADVSRVEIREIPIQNSSRFEVC